MAILISTPQDLSNIRYNLTGEYELVNDIDMSGFGNFTPIASFRGTLNGKGFKIKNLTINTSQTYSALFGYSSGATLLNIGIENVYVKNKGETTAGLVAELGAGTISNCFVTGLVDATGYNRIGGLVGLINGSTVLVENSYSTATIKGSNYIGGFVGWFNQGTLKNCYSTGSVVSNGSDAGGLVGKIGSITSINSYWDINTSGKTVSATGTGKTTSQMKSQSSYTNWDFVNTWGINNDYPYLQVFGIPQAPAKIETITVNSYSNKIHSQLNKVTKSIKQSNSYIEPITSSVSRSKRSQYKVDSFMLPINTNVQRSTRSVRLGKYNVVTFINPITSSIKRRTKTYKNLLSYVSDINSNIYVKYPSIIINAYTSILENPSGISKLNNLSSLSKIENPSFLEVV